VSSTADVVIVGGGIVGSSAAYRLARLGKRVTLVDRVDQGLATNAGAGIIAPGTTHTTPPAYFPLSFASVAYYPTLLEQLAEDGETDPGYGVLGSLFVATDEAELERLPEIYKLATDRAAMGVKNIGTVTMLTGAEAKEISPALADIPAAIHLTGSARMDARIMRDALRRASAKHGLNVVLGDAEILREGDRVTGVRVEADTISADAVILSAGAWSASLADAMGFRLPVEPQRGQIIHLTMPDADTSAWPIISGFHSQYQLTFPKNKVVVGATRETGSGYDYRLTAGGIYSVLGEALRVSPGLANGTIAEIRIGFRPMSIDGLPIMGKAPNLRNLFLATGHGASGLSLGPFSGAAVADLTQGLPVELDLTPYSADRFQNGSGDSIPAA
jgi:D-amino-acid dehydrogenase